ncbi:hypothetical protein BN1723_009918, partial [Verticillium longisporum]
EHIVPVDVAMSSPNYGFSPWRRRASSLSTQTQPTDDAQPTPINRPNRNSLPPNSDSLRQLSSSTGQREPIRSFIHGSVRDDVAPVDSAEYLRHVREDTAELASYLLSDKKSNQSPAFLSRRRSQQSQAQSLLPSEDDDADYGSETIHEVSEPPSPHNEIQPDDELPDEGPSILTSLLRKSPPQSRGASSPSPEPRVPEIETPALEQKRSRSSERQRRQRGSMGGEEAESTERTPLLGRVSSDGHGTNGRTTDDVEGQKPRPRRQWLNGLKTAGHNVEASLARTAKAATSPQIWNRKSLWANVVVAPVSCLPAVIVGLLLNVLDALSYGKTARQNSATQPTDDAQPTPINRPNRNSLPPNSDSLRQLSSSTGQREPIRSFIHGSVRGDLAPVDSAEYLRHVREDTAELASYLLSDKKSNQSPAFLSRRRSQQSQAQSLLPSEDDDADYGSETIHEVSEPPSPHNEIQPDDELPDEGPSILTSLLRKSPPQSRGASSPSPDPRVPEIETPALEQKRLRSRSRSRSRSSERQQRQRGSMGGEEAESTERTPLLGRVSSAGHGTNGHTTDDVEGQKPRPRRQWLNGLKSVGHNVEASLARTAKAATSPEIWNPLTFCVLMVGPMIIGFIPVMMVGTLIFDLGFELLLEAVWLPRKKLKLAEYLTVIVIVLIMGIYDFVIGIGTSRVPAVRASYNGDIVGSTVRRNPGQHRYLQQVRRQIYIVKLTGFLFFGTIVSVEEKIRALIEDDAFSESPIKFLILDLYHVSGLDYSAGEAFNTISRLLDNKGVVLVISGVDAETELGRNLRAVGLGSESVEVTMLPDLNSALESCENELLKTLYANQEELHAATRPNELAAQISTTIETPALEQKRLRSRSRSRSRSSERQQRQRGSMGGEEAESTERTPLLGRVSSAGHGTNGHTTDDVEGQKPRPRRQWLNGLKSVGHNVEASLARTAKAATSPEIWNRQSLWANVVVAPVSCLPAVIVGLLLNVLDALSYGMILFPLGKPIFAGLGSAGISIFYVSTIVSQLTFSAGSGFRGAVGSELIEVVPFFHNMAQTITDIVGEENPDAVIATTITAYAISSMVTGLVFYLMGKFNFGYMVGFIPRHILIGCIGGVGWFLVATGFEVSARMSGSLEYNLETLRKLFQHDTVLLWVIPLILAIVLFYGQAKVASKYFLPLYITAIPIIFYFFVTVIDTLDVDPLRDNGWIFEGPPADEPWWYFWTLYKFHLVRWEAILDTIPAMLALTFFGILHVPINVPALALQTGEDHADLDRELKLHGYSNFLSGCFGSIQNYLVYGDLLAAYKGQWTDIDLTGSLEPPRDLFIDVRVLKDAGEIQTEYGSITLTKNSQFYVIIIVLIMGIYDFVIGIGVGILLAFISLIFQTSRVPAVRASYNGDIVGSTVRRNPGQHRYLQQVRRQIYIVKLTGFLFFGTVVSVEEKIRALIEDDAFSESPIKFLILDLYHVSGLDYSAGEAFNTISRLLDNKGVVLVISGVDAETELGRNLRAVGLGSESVEVTMLPDLNSALESCENELLKTLYANQEELHAATRNTPTASLDVPVKADVSSALDGVFNSPRRNHLRTAAKNALTNTESQQTTRWQSFKEPLRLMLQIFQGLTEKNEDFWFRAVPYFQTTRWQSFKEPLRLMLQIFQGLTEKNEDFWFRAVPYFVRREFVAGSTLYRRGETASGFYLVEQGILRAEYDLPQGWLTESIVAGTTCGELPFFSETERTANVLVEGDCVAWLMDTEGWERLQKEEPDVARELLRISLKLTSERLSSITSYILTMAG